MGKIPFIGKILIAVAVVAIGGGAFAGASHYHRAQLAAVEVQDGSTNGGDVIPKAETDPGVNANSGETSDGTEVAAVDETAYAIDDGNEVSPGTHDGYHHEVGGVGFYTHHNLYDYVTPSWYAPGKELLDVESMVKDIWGSDRIIIDAQNGGYADNAATRSVAFWHKYSDKTTQTFAVTADGPTSVVTCWHAQRPANGWWCEINTGFGFTPEMAALLLYVLEQTELEPRYNIGGELELPNDYECSDSIR